MMSGQAGVYASENIQLHAIAARSNQSSLLCRDSGRTSCTLKACSSRVSFILDW